MKWRHGWLRRKYQFSGWKRFQNHFKLCTTGFFTKANVKTRSGSTNRSKTNKVSYFPLPSTFWKSNFWLFLVFFITSKRVLTFAFVKKPCRNTLKWVLNRFQPENRLFLRSHPCRHIPLIYENWPLSWDKKVFERRPHAWSTFSKIIDKSFCFRQGWPAERKTIKRLYWL